VLSVDAENKRISLGLKQIEPNPWEIIKDKYQPGAVIKGVVKNVTDFGVFVGTEEGVDGLVHISDISWLKKIKHPAELYKRGQEVDAVVLNIDPEAERFTLGIKQLTEDPWKTELSERYKTGTILEGEVVSITNFGVFLRLEHDVEGLIHVSELSKKRIEDPNSFCSVGDKLRAVVVNFDSQEKKIGLSIKALEKSEEQDTIDSYMKKQQSANVQLGDMLKKKMEENEVDLSKSEDEKDKEE
jgi:small subunit ribosomal protein S1